MCCLQFQFFARHYPTLRWENGDSETYSVLFKHKLRVKRVSEVSGIYGICKVYHREKFRCLNFQVTGVKLFCGGTTLHFIALSYKDRAVISWKPSSYLTQFHRCDIKVAYYIGYLYSSRRVSHLYYRSGMRVNWTIYYIYTRIYGYANVEVSHWKNSQASEINITALKQEGGHVGMIGQRTLILFDRGGEISSLSFSCYAQVVDPVG